MCVKYSVDNTSYLLWLQGTRGDPGDPGPRGDSGSPGPKVSKEFNFSDHQNLAKKLQRFIIIYMFFPSKGRRGKTRIQLSWTERTHRTVFCLLYLMIFLHVPLMSLFESKLFSRETEVIRAVEDPGEAEVTVPPKEIKDTKDFQESL